MLIEWVKTEADSGHKT